ncbi:MAG: hypothetical protein QOG67_3810 [Verrucomicrobiota bacterium]|jgi:class 3 adenylate cyclase/tetratricopeptide (TPR) repeat protein
MSDASSDHGQQESLVGSIATGDLTQLMSIWRGREGQPWARSNADIYYTLARRILGQGEPLIAYDIIAEALAIWPSDVRLRQLQGLALARSGATERANALLEQLRKDGATDEETLGTLGRTYKDLALNAGSPTRELLLRHAAGIYEEAYGLSGGYWTGINAATMHLLIGEKERACQIANKVREECLKEVQDPGGDQYWELAALGEAALICRRWSEAEEWYSRAANERQTRFGDLHSSRRNARLILHYWQKEAPAIERALHVPAVVVFVGHMIDRSDRSVPRFPPELEFGVANELAERLNDLKPAFGFSSAACGSDILFLEAMLERGAEVSIVLPYDRDEFVRDSVDFVPNSNWRARFDAVISRASRVLTASTQRLEIGGVSYEFCNDVLLGLSVIRARELETELLPLAVWNGQVGDGPGGAATVVQNWRALRYQPEIIDLEEICKGSGSLPSRRQRRPQQKSHRSEDHKAAADQFTSRVVTLLFADAIGFSKLAESEVPRFVEHFLGAIAKLSENFADRLLAKNTWGDGLYFVFSDVAAAGKFGLELADLVAGTNWDEKKLRPGLSLRIGLHAGPAYEFDDPITGHRSYSGTHVSRAARIEPITPPGQVYASEAFAALAAARRVADFTCDYVGQTPMAKDYGEFPTYHVRRNLSRQ